MRGGSRAYGIEYRIWLWPNVIRIVFVYGLKTSN